jgi:hypothetical protein
LFPIGERKPMQHSKAACLRKVTIGDKGGKVALVHRSVDGFTRAWIKV